MDLIVSQIEPSARTCEDEVCEAVWIPGGDPLTKSPDVIRTGRVARA